MYKYFKCYTIVNHKSIRKLRVPYLNNFILFYNFNQLKDFNQAEIV